MSRDPIGEYGGWNLHAPIRNHIVNRQDHLGMEKYEGCCGKSIGDSLLQTLQGLEQHLDNFPDEKERVCLWMNDHEFGWDVEELFNEGQEPSPNLFGSSPPNSKCSKTVTVDGKCYKVWAVNYFLWGKMNKICGNWSGAAVVKVLSYRLISYDKSEGEKRSIGIASRSGWTLRGYFSEGNSFKGNDIGEKLVNTTECDKCKPCEVPYDGNLTIRLRRGRDTHLKVQTNHVIETKNTKDEYGEDRLWVLRQRRLFRNSQ